MNLSTRQQTCLKLIGIDIWVTRDSSCVSDASETSDSDRQIHENDGGNSGWINLKEQVSTCTRCSLHQTRTQTVFGSGSVDADWMLIGEAPGAEEDRQGRPFVGRAGKLLTSMLQAIGLDRDRVYIANILKCRPPSNRDPSTEEVSCCEEYLRQQILYIKPKIILALGRIAAQNLLKTDTPISKMRGRIYEYGDPAIPLVVTYHPAYLLRSPREKRKSWQDLQIAVKKYNEIKE